MQMSLLDVLITTVVSMGIVFVMLTILMYLMEGSSWVIRTLEAKYAKKDEKKPEVAVSVATPQQGEVTFDTDEYARVAALVALTQASQDQPNKHFEVLSIEKKVS